MNPRADGRTPVSDRETRQLLEALRSGKRAALARAISIVENDRPGAAEILQALHGETAKSHRIGITGPPGAGKSTLTAALIERLRRRGQTVGVVAVDPTSPFSGGAVLGDRIRMAAAATDPGVFIRSTASRGAIGGLALTTNEIADVMDAFGFDRLFIETVGVGQAELDIAAAADTTIVLLVPESGDSVQAMKAGLLEIADVFVVNKADRPGATRLARELELTLHLRTGQPRRLDEAAVPDPERPWPVPVLKTIAESGEGVDDVLGALDRHLHWLEASGERERRRRSRTEKRVRQAVGRILQREVWVEGGGEAELDRLLPEVLAGKLTPYEAAAQIVRASRS